MAGRMRPKRQELDSPVYVSMLELSLFSIKSSWDRHVVIIIRKKL
jgi:hypothetical protein